jgi:hypothetical protein
MPEIYDFEFVLSQVPKSGPGAPIISGVAEKSGKDGARKSIAKAKRL